MATRPRPDAETSPAWQRLSADARRSALIDATAACLADNGLAGTTVRGICARAGVSPGLLRHYFAGVDELIAATYQATSDRLDALFADAVAAAAPNPRARLTAYLAASFRPPVTDPQLLASWTAYWALARSDTAIHAIHAASYAGYRARLEQLLVDCGMDEDMARRRAIMLAALVDGLWLELSLDPTVFDAAAAEAMVGQAVAALVPAA